MNNTQKTAIIRKLVVGRVDHYKDIVVRCDFDMNGTGTSLTFTMKEALNMMNDVGIYDNIMGLVGKPCEIFVDDKNTCHFKGMRKA